MIKFLEDVPQVHTVILAGRWPAYIRGHYTERGEDQLDCELIDASGTATDIPTRSALLERGLDRLVERLSRMDRRVVLVGCVPEIGVDVPTAYGIASRLPWLLDLQTIGPTREEFQHRQMESRELLSNIATRYRASFVEPDSVLWGADGRATILVGDELLYRDDDHLSDAGARHVAPCLDGVFDSLARVKDSGK